MQSGYLHFGSNSHTQSPLSLLLQRSLIKQCVSVNQSIN